LRRLPAAREARPAHPASFNSEQHAPCGRPPLACIVPAFLVGAAQLGGWLAARVYGGRDRAARARTAGGQRAVPCVSERPCSHVSWSKESSQQPSARAAAGETALGRVLVISSDVLAPLGACPATGSPERDARDGRASPLARVPLARALPLSRRPSTRLPCGLPNLQPCCC